MLYVVMGPPCAGKSTWVRERARPGDIVIDFDVIANALVVGADWDNHEHSQAARYIAYGARNAAVKEAMAVSSDVNVFVVHSMPRRSTMNWYRHNGGELVIVDPGRDVVMKRVAEQRPWLHEIAKRWYEGAECQGTQRVS